MGFKTFVNGEVLDASDVNAFLMKQAVIVCTSGTRPSSPVEGMRIHETDTDRELVYNGASWVVDGWYSSAGRYGCIIRRNANQSIPNNTLTAITWDAETSDPEGFIATSSSTLTVPTGGGGLYTIRLLVAPASATTLDIMEMAIGGSALHDTQGAASGAQSASWSDVVLADADTLQFKIRHQLGSAMNITAALTMHRIAS